MTHFLRYVFFRLKSVRARMDPDAEEAKLTAFIYMSLPLGALVISADMIVAYVRHAEPGSTLIGRWPYGLGLFGSIFLLHYMAFAKGAKAKQIDAQFAEARCGMRETFAVAGKTRNLPRSL